MKKTHLTCRFIQRRTPTQSGVISGGELVWGTNTQRHSGGGRKPNDRDSASRERNANRGSSDEEGHWSERGKLKLLPSLTPKRRAWRCPMWYSKAVHDYAVFANTNLKPHAALPRRPASKSGAAPGSPILMPLF